MRSDKPIEIETLVLGESTQVLETESSEDNRRLAVHMVQQAQHRVRIVSRHLDRPIYDHADFVDAVKQMLLNNPRGRVEIIVRDSAPILRRGHRLVALSQRLTSYMEIRSPAKQHEAFNAALLLVDDCGFIDRTFSDRYGGTACLHDPRTCRALNEVFDGMWQAATPDLNLRRLV